MKRVLVWVEWEDGSDPCIAYKKDEMYGKVVSGPNMTLEMLADFCDQNAESCNAHEYVGAHRILACVLHCEGRELATRIMRIIAEHGGLNGMNGMFGEQSAFTEFGINEPWKDWELKP
jgi:hypothetical protein